MLTPANRRALHEIELQAETGKPPRVALKAIVGTRYTVVSANSAVHSAARANAAEALRLTFNNVDNAWIRNDDTPGAVDWTRAAEMERLHRDSLREVFGNPFRKLTIDPAWLRWRDATVRNLAQAAYDERRMPTGQLDPARLALLADALEEAGCTNQDILGHLRDARLHVRGCWVIDALLGKA